MKIKPYRTAFRTMVAGACAFAVQVQGAIITKNDEGASNPLGLENVALQGVGILSTEGFGGTPNRINDGNTSGVFGENSVVHSAETVDAEGRQWVEVNLGGVYSINEIVVYNRTDCCRERATDFRLSISSMGTESWGENYFTSGNINDNFSVLDDANAPIGIGNVVRLELRLINANRIINLAEIQVYGTLLVDDPNIDSDEDGLPDGLEYAAFGDLTSQDGVGDADGDGLTNAQELAGGTSLTQADSDGDGLTDSQEIALSTDPVKSDTDGDGLGDGLEALLGYNPTHVDSDRNGIPDNHNLVASRVYHQEFTAADAVVDLADGSTIASAVEAGGTVAQIEGNALLLTRRDVAGARASYRLPALGAEVAQGFIAMFDFTLADSEGGNPPADGFSFNFGAIPAYDAAANVADPAGHGQAEEGFGPGLSVEVDTWDAPVGEAGYNVAVNGVDVEGGTVARIILPQAGTLDTNAIIIWNKVGEDSGELTLVVGTEVIFDGIATPGFAPTETDIFAFSARTGGATEDLIIDNLSIHAPSITPSVDGALQVHYEFEDSEGTVVVNGGSAGDGTLNSADAAAARASGTDSPSIGGSGALFLAELPNIDATYIDTNATADTLRLNGPQNYTTMAWLKPTANTGDRIAFGQATGNALHHGIRDGRAHFGHWGNDLGSGASPIAVNEWIHVAWIYSGGVQTLVLNGQVTESGARGPLANASNVLIGLTLPEDATDRNFEGWLDDVRIYSAPLTVDRIAAIAGLNGADSLKIHYNFEEGEGTTVINEGNLDLPDGTLHSADIAAARGSTFFSPSMGGNGMLYLDATPSPNATHVDTGLTLAELDLNGAIDYTMTAWMRPTSTAGGDRMIFGQQSGTGLHNGIRDNRLHIGHWGNDIGGPASAVTANLWTHVAFRYEGGTLSILRNGVVTDTDVRGPINNPDALVLIGASRTAELDDSDFEGYLDDVRIYGGALTNDEVRRIAQIGVDSDGDGLDDNWERAAFGTLDRNGVGDFDGDRLSDAAEHHWGTDPAHRDTDRDGLWDGEEVIALHTNPLSGDTDHDGVSDFDEFETHKTDPLAEDTDRDGMLDGWELANEGNPTVYDERSPEDFLRIHYDFEGATSIDVENKGGDAGNGVVVGPVSFEEGSPHIVWVSDITDPAGADSGFIDLLTGSTGSGEFSQLWQVGLEDDVQTEFSQEAGPNPAPGSASAQDDDFYFAGTYPDPIGVVEADEAFLNYDRALTPGDTINRIHFNLSDEDIAETEFKITVDLCCVGAAEGIVASHDVVFKFNGTEFHSVTGIAGDHRVEETRAAAALGAVVGENILEIERVGGSDSSWIQFDFLRLEKSASAGGPGYEVTRVDLGNELTPDNVVMLNAADLVILGRANGSGQYMGVGATQWNTEITTPLITMSAYLARANRMQWMDGDALPDSAGHKLRVEDPTHPVFEGIDVVDGVTVNDFNILIGQGTSTNLGLPVNGTVLGTALLPEGVLGVSIAEWDAGTTIGGAEVLAGYRMLFNGGNREPVGGAVADAGMVDLTEDGQAIFLNAVAHAIEAGNDGVPSGPSIFEGGMLTLQGVNGENAIYIDTQVSADALGINGAGADYTMMARVMPASVEGDNMVFGQFGAVAEKLHLGLRANQAHFGHWGADSNSGAYTLQTGQWYDIAWRYSDGIQTIIINGEIVSQSAQGPLRNADNLVIGISAGDAAFEGSIDDVKVYNGGFSEDWIRELQGRNAGASELVVHYEFEHGISPEIVNSGNRGASSGQLNSLDIIGAFGSGSPSKGGPGMMRFDASNGADATYINTQLTPEAAGVKNSSYTMMAWVKQAAIGDGNDSDAMIFGQVAGSVLHNGARGMGYHQGHWGNDQTKGTIELNVWHHVAFVYDGAETGVMTIVVDGAPIGSEQRGGLSLSDELILIGTTSLADNRDYIGDLDDVRIYSGALTAGEISEIAGVVDSDGDGLLDSFERLYFGGLVAADGTGDNDGDGLTNAEELAQGTNPASGDSDGDGWGDSVELDLATDPADATSFPDIFADGGLWEVRTVRSASTQLTNLATVDMLLNGEIEAAEDVTTHHAFINFGDGAAGRFASDQVYSIEADGDKEDFAILAKGTIYLNHSGVVTFNSSTDDGGRLRIDGADVFVDDALHGAQDLLRSIELSAGYHDVEYVMFERGGGDAAELSVGMTFGAFGTFEASPKGWELLPAADSDLLKSKLVAWWPMDGDVRDWSPGGVSHNGVLATENSYQQTFSAAEDATDLGDGSTIGSNNGTTKVVGGRLQLTSSAITSTNASFRLPSLGATTTNGFVASFDFHLADVADGNSPADGFSFNYGAIPAYDSGADPGSPNGNGGAEEGFGTGLSVEFDTYQLGDAEHGYNVAVNGVDVEGGFTNTAVLAEGQSRMGHAEIVWEKTETAGELTLIVDGAVIFDSISTGAFAPVETDIFAFSARTGGLAEDLFLDNLQISPLNDPGSEYSSGVFGSALSLTGVGSAETGRGAHVVIGDHSDLEFEASEPWSMSLWYKRDGIENDQGLLTKGYGDPSRATSYYLMNTRLDGFSFDSREGDADEPRIRIDSEGVNHGDNEWHHIVAVRDSGAGEFRFYVDGVKQVRALDAGGNWPMGVNNDPLMIGNHFSRFSMGAFDDIGVWKGYALTDADVELIANEGISAAAEGGALVAHWSFDEAAGTSGEGSIVDQVGAFNGTPTDVVLGSPGAQPYSGTSAEFNGTSSLVQVPQAAALNPTSFTITAWANARTTEGYASLITSRYDEAQGAMRHGFIIYNAASTNWESWAGTGAADWGGIAGPAVVANSWTHIAVTYDDSIPLRILYVNGEEAARSNLPISPNLTQPLNIGAGQDLGDGFFFDGFIDDLAIFNIALSPGRVKQIMEAGVVPTEEGELQVAPHPNLDSDRDGFTDASESIAGTDPHDSTHYLKIDAVITTADGIEVNWMAAPGRVYEIEFSATLEAGSWEVIGSVTAESEGLARFEDLDVNREENRSGYYRTRVIAD